MNEMDVDLVGAINWVEEYQASLINKFVHTVEHLPSFGSDVDPQLAKYIQGIGSFVRGHDAWCFESERYFGKNGRDVERHRWITLIPRRQHCNQL